MVDFSFNKPLGIIPILGSKFMGYHTQTTFIIMNNKVIDPTYLINATRMPMARKPK
jgi:hypothetical protein